MRKSGWTPSIVPNGAYQTVYIVADDFGRNGRCYRETDVEAADLETVITDLLEGQYKNPYKVVAFNTAEGWSQDVSEDIAQELRRRCDLQLRDVPSAIVDFVEANEGYGPIAELDQGQEPGFAGDEAGQGCVFLGKFGTKLSTDS